MNQCLDVLRLDTAITEHLVRPSVDRHHTIEETRLPITVQLHEDLAFAHEIAEPISRGAY